MPTYPASITLTNPGFETGDATGWTQLSGANAHILTTSLDGTNPHSGTYFAAGAASVATAWWGQTITLDAEYHDDIDAGRLEATLTVWREGHDPDTDSGQVAIGFFDESDNFLSEPFSPRTDYTTWTQDTLTRWVPPGTRKIRVSARVVRASGTEASAYFDDFALSLDQTAVAHSHLYGAVNDATGWTAVSGTVAVAGSALTYGETPLKIDGVATGHIYRDIAVPANTITSVDAGEGALKLFLQQGRLNTTENDTSRAYIEFYDASAVKLGSTQYTDASEVTGNVNFDPKSIEVAVPADTRTIRLGIVGTRASGSNIDCCMCRISVMLEANQEDLGGGGSRPQFFICM
jgi:hypothetical protein